MSDDLPPVGFWQASDGRWYPPELHPDRPRDPPSARKALTWTLLCTWMWFLLPVAIHYVRKAQREADGSGGRYRFRRTLLHRPLVLLGLMYGAVMLFFVAIVALGLYGDPAPPPTPR